MFGESPGPPPSGSLEHNLLVAIFIILLIQPVGLLLWKFVRWSGGHLSELFDETEHIDL